MIWNQYPLGQEPGGSAPCVSDPSSASSWWRWRRSWRRCKASQGSRRRCRWPDSPSPLDSHHSFHALLILVIKRFIICLNFSRVSPSSVFQFLVPGNNEGCRRSRACSACWHGPRSRPAPATLFSMVLSVYYSNPCPPSAGSKLHPRNHSVAFLMLDQLKGCLASCIC